ncbi:UDP-N-acetylmuramoyl-tripeptide--D-alanyl-D-alanine ligase [Candidatus Methanobinarius endosymbioticus]|uniref:Lipid II isoglutaminyl synthase (glutamine-hydrolyzing) subunit MurT n=1 Tax=Candidatus Methanobinarius endosymbioticus TaxID=2006182 RepID=A0A366MF64_9EURY|nr:UDP-N-acetylmuramoyl-tripeptide--D-alanyl-D-alanine ligase [Candidatus Methanobinarius endosymbioticus]
MTNTIIFNIAILAGKLAYFILQITGRQGTALPGKVAIKICPDILGDLTKRCNKIVVITGTNGKTTTNNLINHIIGGKYENLVSNLKGANMIQGVVTSFVVNTKSSYDWGIFEVDEGSIPDVTHFISPDHVALTNFFRDQLDRYGEVENTIKMVYDALKTVDSTIILNGDDPSTVQFNKLSNNKIYYGFNKNQFSKSNHDVAEAIFCKNCGNRLNYEFISYGNIGCYYCENCGSKRPNLNYVAQSIYINDNNYEFDLKINMGNDDKNSLNNDETIEKGFVFKYMGIYNIYNCLAAISLCLSENFDIQFVKNQIENFDYKLGRMETINFPDKNVVLVLSKNPVGLSEVFHAFSYDEEPKSLMFLINDTHADGKDISWIWDADFEQITDIKNIKSFYCSGTRANEAALRLKYAGFDIAKIKIHVSKDEGDFNYPINEMLSENVKSYVIGTFTATPEARKILLSEKAKSEI